MLLPDIALALMVLVMTPAMTWAVGEPADRDRTLAVDFDFVGSLAITALARRHDRRRP